MVVVVGESMKLRPGVGSREELFFVQKYVFNKIIINESLSASYVSSFEIKIFF